MSESSLFIIKMEKLNKKMIEEMIEDLERKLCDDINNPAVSNWSIVTQTEYLLDLNKTLNNQNGSK